MSPAAIVGLLAVIGIGVYLVSMSNGGGSFLGRNLSFAQIQQYAQSAGFSGDDLNTAAAIALAESSGNPSALGDTGITPGGSVGLWQVNLQAHPEYTAAQLNDPQANANAAFAIYQAAGNTFSPWSTFTSGAYQQYLPASSTPSAGDGTETADASAGTTGTDDSAGYGDSGDDESEDQNV